MTSDDYVLPAEAGFSLDLLDDDPKVENESLIELTDQFKETYYHLKFQRRFDDESFLKSITASYIRGMEIAFQVSIIRYRACLGYGILLPRMSGLGLLLFLSLCTIRI